MTSLTETLGALVCGGCGTQGLRFFRSTGTGNIEARCAHCLDAANVARSGNRFDWWFPAIPHADGGWWSYTCIPRSATRQLSPLRDELRRAYSRSRGEAADGSSFICARCCTKTPADEGRTELEGICDACWCVVSPLFEPEQDTPQGAPAAPVPSLLTYLRDWLAHYPENVFDPPSKDAIAAMTPEERSAHTAVGAHACRYVLQRIIQDVESGRLCNTPAKPE